MEHDQSNHTFIREKKKKKNTRATSTSWSHLLPSNYKQKFTLRYMPIKEQEADKSLSKAAGHNANVARWHKNNVVGMTYTGTGKPKQTRSVTNTSQTAVNLGKNDPVQAVQKAIPVTRVRQYGRVTECILYSEFRLTARSAALRSPQFPSDMSRGLSKCFRSKHWSYYRYLPTLSTDYIAVTSRFCTSNN